MGKAIKSVAKVAAPLSGALGGGGISDILFGKKGGGVSRSPLAAQAEALQKKTFGLQAKGLAAAEKQFGDTEGFIRTQQAQQVKQAQASAADQQRALQGRLARRGLGGSSVGLGAQRAIGESLAERTGQIGRAAPGLRQQAINGLLGQAGQVGRGLNVPIAFRAKKAKRSGGISGALGAGIGGAFGGPAGAKIGGSIGGALGQ